MNFLLKTSFFALFFLQYFYSCKSAKLNHEIILVKYFCEFIDDKKITQNKNLYTYLSYVPSKNYMYITTHFKAKKIGWKENTGSFYYHLTDTCIFISEDKNSIKQARYFLNGDTIYGNKDYLSFERKDSIKISTYCISKDTFIYYRNEKIDCYLFKEKISGNKKVPYAYTRYLFLEKMRLIPVFIKEEYIDNDNVFHTRIYRPIFISKKNITIFF